MLVTRTFGKYPLRFSTPIPGQSGAREDPDSRFNSPEYTKDARIKEVVTLTSDLSRKNLEKDFERMDTPQGTFYRVYFDIYLTLDGSEFNAELVCQNEVMGRCTARFR